MFRINKIIKYNETYIDVNKFRDFYLKIKCTDNIDVSLYLGTALMNLSDFHYVVDIMKDNILNIFGNQWTIKINIVNKVAYIDSIYDANNRIIDINTISNLLAKILNQINTSFFQINYYFNKKIDTNNMSVNKIISREIEIKN